MLLSPIWGKRNLSVQSSISTAHPNKHTKSGFKSAVCRWCRDPTRDVLHGTDQSLYSACDIGLGVKVTILTIYTRQKRKAPLRNVQLSGRSQVIGQFSLYQCKCMSSTTALHIFCN